jgi:hypothetical protein
VIRHSSSPLARHLEATGQIPTVIGGTKLPGDRPGLDGQYPRILAIPPWDVSPIPTATPFYLSQLPNLILANVAGAVVGSTIPGGGAIQMPPKNVAVLAGVILYCNNPDLTTQIRYTIRQNGSPVPGLASVGFPPQVNAFLNWAIDGPFDALTPGAFIDFIVTNITPGTGPWTVNVAISGWFCSIDDVARYTGKRPGTI